MFNLTLLDHLRLTFSQVIQRQKAHADAAHSYNRWNRRLRGAEALLMTGVTITAVADAFGRGHVLGITAAALAGTALLVLLVHLTFDFENSAHAHEACSIQLWYMRERYRALLSDLHDGVLDINEARVRRDRLMDELRGIYEKFPGIDLESDRKARRKKGAPAPEPEATDELMPGLESTRPT